MTAPTFSDRAAALVISIIGDTPAARAASDEDLRRMLAQRLEVAPATSQHPVGAPGWIAEMGPHVRRVRHRHGVRIDELARHLGCDVATLTSFELGEYVEPARFAETDLVDDSRLHNFEPTQAEALAHALDVAGAYTATTIARRWSVSGTFRVLNAAGEHVADITRSYPVPRTAVPRG
jgi:hypothetical protein